MKTTITQPDKATARPLNLPPKPTRIKIAEGGRIIGHDFQTGKPITEGKWIEVSELVRVIREKKCIVAPETYEFIDAVKSLDFLKAEHAALKAVEEVLKRVEAIPHFSRRSVEATRGVKTFAGRNKLADDIRSALINLEAVRKARV